MASLVIIDLLCICDECDLSICIFSVTAVVGALPSTDVSERLLLLLKTLSDKSRASSSKRAKKSTYKVGSAVEGEVRVVFFLFGFYLGHGASVMIIDFCELPTASRVFSLETVQVVDHLSS